MPSIEDEESTSFFILSIDDAHHRRPRVYSLVLHGLCAIVSGRRETGRLSSAAPAPSGAGAPGAAAGNCRFWYPDHACCTSGLGEADPCISWLVPGVFRQERLHGPPFPPAAYLYAVLYFAAGCSRWFALGAGEP